MLNITKRERITNGFLKIDQLTIDLPNGRRIIREVVQKPDGIAIIAVSHNGEVFLTKQPRGGVNLLESIEIPAGLIEKGEEPEVAAIRELSEETGCSLTQPMISLGRFASDPACSTNITNLFLALNVVKDGELKLDEDECLECFTKNVSEAYKMIEDGQIMDAPSIIAFSRAKKYLKKEKLLV